MSMSPKQIGNRLEIVLDKLSKEDVVGAVTELTIAVAYLCDHVKELNQYIEDRREMARIASGDQ